MSSVAYVWQDADGVTGEYHNSGGVLIVTDRDPRDVWREYVKQHNDNLPKWGDPIKADALAGIPDHTFPAEHNGPLVVVFPNAGCC